MKVALTGATGLIGPHILTELREHDHEAVALVRDADQADRAAASRATPVVVDLYDRPTVVRQLSGADRAIHTASPGAATSANLDVAVADPAIGAFAGAGKPYLHISGAWIYGNNTSISEESPMNPSAFVAWKVPIQHRILNAAGMRGAVIVSSTAYGDGGGGIPALLLGSPRDDAGNLIMIGTGQQHSSTVHVADLANLFRRVLEGDSARGYHLVGDGRNPTVAEPTEPATDATGASGAVPGSDEEARATLRRLFRRSPPARSGHACRQGSGRTRVVLDTPDLVDELRHGSNSKQPTG
jgi:nucleoside-diphosphate-sugar epimerase